jgi:transcriptional regulator with XRE-family HTH domain
MDSKEIGLFLKSLRVAKGYTQQEAADKLYLSAKTVSKWEVGDGIPDISILPAVADLYGVTIDEILRGKKNSPEESLKPVDAKAAENASKAMANAIENKFSSYFWTSFGFSLALFIAGIIVLFFSYFFVGEILGFFGIIVSLFIIIAGKNNVMKDFEEEDEKIFALAKGKAQKRINRKILFLSYMLLAMFSVLSIILFYYGGSQQY